MLPKADDMVAAITPAAMNTGRMAILPYSRFPVLPFSRRWCPPVLATCLWWFPLPLNGFQGYGQLRNQRSGDRGRHGMVQKNTRGHSMAHEFVDQRSRSTKNISPFR